MSTETPEQWWVTTHFFHRGGEKILGPFESQELALTVRSFVERAEQHDRYFIDSEPVPAVESQYEYRTMEPGYGPSSPTGMGTEGLKEAQQRALAGAHGAFPERRVVGEWEPIPKTEGER
jgi:hypothetical protein